MIVPTYYYNRDQQEKLWLPKMCLTKNKPEQAEATKALLKLFSLYL